MVQSTRTLEELTNIHKTCADKKEIDKAMKELKKDEFIASPKRCYWEPK